MRVDCRQGGVRQKRTRLQQLQVRPVSPSQKPAPFEEGGVAKSFESGSAFDVPLMIEMVVYRRMGGSEFL